MKQYVLDTNAVIRYVLGGKGADKVEAILRQASEIQANIRMSVINLGEVYYVLMHHGGENAAAKTVHGLRHIISFVPVNLEDAVEAAIIKERFKLGYADCFAAALALRVDGTLVSADTDFVKLGRSLKLLKLPRYTEP